LILIQEIENYLFEYQQFVSILISKEVARREEIKRQDEIRRDQIREKEELRREKEKKLTDTSKNKKKGGYYSEYNPDQEEDKFMGAAVATSAAVSIAAIGNVSDFNDDPSEKFITGFVGFGYSDYPMVTTTSYPTTPSNPSISKNRGTNCVFVDAGAHYNHMSEGLFSYNVGAFFRYGSNSMLSTNKGVSGDHFQYGLEARAMLGKKVKFNAIAGINYKSGDINTRYLDYFGPDQYYGEYKYSSYRYGGGLSYHAEGLNRGFELYAVKDNVLSGNNIQTDALVFGLRIKYTAVFSLEYTPKYISAGVLKHPNAFDKDNNLSYLSVHITVPFVLWKSDY
jgi:hypothetical protein